MPSIKAIFSADATQHDRVMRQMVSGSAAAAKSISRHFKTEIAEIDKAIAKLPSGSLLLEKLAARKSSLEARLNPSSGMGGHGRIGGVGAASSMFVSAARDSAASLASGAPPEQIFAQQAPQVLQALTMMKIGLASIVRFVLPFAALATAAFFVVRHFQKLAEHLKNLNALTDSSTIAFTDQAHAIKEAATEAQSFQDWLRSLGDSQNHLKDKTEAAILALREQAKLERAIAQQRGASARKLAEMDIAAAEKELAALKKAKAEAEQSFFANTVDAESASRDAGNPDRKAKLATLGKLSSQAGAVADAVQKAMKESKISELDPALSNTSVLAGGGPVYRRRAATESDVLTVDVDGKEYKLSMAQAREAFDKVTKEESELAAKQKELGDLLDSKKKLTEKDNARINQLNSDIENLEGTLGEQKKLLPFQQATAKGGHGIAITEWERAGGFMAGPQVALLDVAKAQLKSSQRIEKLLSKTTLKAGHSGVKY